MHSGHSSAQNHPLPKEGVLSAQVLNMYLQLCARHGLDRDRTLRDTGISERDLNPASGWVGQEIVERLFLYRLNSLPMIPGIQLATEMDPSRDNGGLLGFVCMSCPSIADLHNTLSQFGPLSSTLFSTYLTYQPGAVLWCVDMAYHDERVLRDNVEWFLGACALIIQRMNPDALREVHLAHAPMMVGDAQHPYYQRAFRCPIIFNASRSVLVIDPVAFSAKANSGDLAVFEVLREQAAKALQQINYELPLVERVRKEIYLLLAEGRISREAVCQRLGISARHLHRQLQQFGSSYQTLLDDLRAESALKELSERRHELDALSRDLGFSSSKAFSRWFRTRFDMTPTDYRRSLG